MVGAGSLPARLHHAKRSDQSWFDAMENHIAAPADEKAQDDDVVMDDVLNAGVEMVLGVHVDDVLEMNEDLEVVRRYSKGSA